MSDSLWPHGLHHAPLSSNIVWILLRFMSTESWSYWTLILCCPLLLPSIFPGIRISSNELAFHIRWPRHLCFSFRISPSNEYSGLISFRMDLFDLLSVQGTLKNLLQHHSLKASIFWHSAFFMVQLSHLCLTTRRTISLTIWTFVGKDWGQEEKRVTEDEMVEWHHQLNEHEFKQTLGDSEGQGGLALYNPWSHKDLYTT